jgi:hypothetical protein
MSAMLPNFLVVGAEKAGTTTLARMSSCHSEVFMSDPKEPQFFSDHNWGKGIRWYESLFTGAEGFKAVGEASPSYTWAPESGDVPRRIAECLGPIRYIYILRHPVERIVSHYRHALLHHWIPDETSIEKALELKPALMDCSRYYYQIEQFLPFTSREQWCVPILEDLTRDPSAVLSQVFLFLGIDDRISVGLISENVTDQRRRIPAWMYRLKPLSAVVPSAMWRAVRRLAERVVGEKLAKPAVPAELEAGLARQLRPDIERLSEFCRRDFLSLWGMNQ